VVVDDLESLVERLLSRDHDLVVTIGGTSVGRRDLVPEAMARVGETLIHGIAVKPGKPLLLGRVEGRPTVGLPGFPTTCMMQGHAILDPIVRGLAGNPARRARVRAPLAADVRSVRAKVQLLPIALVDGAAVATFTASSSVSSMARAHGWTVIPADVEKLPAGTEVEVVLF